ncbi:Mitochondrial import inner membrane translocase subunit TIM50 [Trichostrongylus colubriformis]|uniref:Mitochondrial import inner membrane translocase subunit TIM50 n=1 Tax=Trichostrongylus colubriformis TaxID=6319 RepID=A0AAN8FRT7_TRICO
MALRLALDCVHRQVTNRICSSIVRRPYCNEKVFKSLLSDAKVASPFADPSRTVKSPMTAPNTAYFSVPREDSDDIRPKIPERIRTSVPNLGVKDLKTEEKATKTEDKKMVLDEQPKKLSAVEELNLLKGELEKTAEKSDAGGGSKGASGEERRRKRLERNTRIGGAIVFGSTVAGFVAFCLYYGRAKRDEAGNIVPDEWTGTYFAAFYRIANSFRVWRDFVVEPAREQLLPDPLPHPYIQPKYTLVIEMKNVLVHPDWTYKTGYRFAKRPALEYFLDVVGYPNFEVVIYTSESMMTAHPVVDSFDPKQRIMYRLYRDCTKYMHGQHVKDLSKLNRDLSKVIFIEVDPKAAQLNPENMLLLPEWKGNMDDTSLVDLAELLKTIHLSDVEDVRPTLQYYSQFPDPAKEFRRRAIYLAEQEEQKKHQREEEGHSLLKKYSGRLFGFRRHAPT